MKLLILFIFFSIISFKTQASPCELAYLSNSKNPISRAQAWRKKFQLETHWTSKVKLTSDNGIEIEGVFEKGQLSLSSLANKYVVWLKNHPSEFIKHVSLTSNKSQFKIKFTFMGEEKSFLIQHELIPSTDHNHNFSAVELSSHIIKTQDDLRLFSQLQEMFYKFGVIEENLTAGIHNHIALTKLIGHEVRDLKDPQILELGRDFKKVEQGLFDYFFTHPYRNSSTGRLLFESYLQNKIQAIVLKKDQLTGVYITLELRIFNANKDPEYLAEAMIFTNKFFSQYFNSQTGLKEWIRQQGGVISSKELFQKIGISHTLKKHAYQVLEMPFNSQRRYLEIFGSHTDKAFSFLEKHIIKNFSSNKESFEELFQYLLYIQKHHQVSYVNIEQGVSSLMSKIRPLFKNKLFLGSISKLNHFNLLDYKYKKIFFDIFFPSGLANSSTENAIHFVKNTLFTEYNLYPFSTLEFDSLYLVAKNYGDLADASKIILLQHPDHHKHLMSLRSFQNEFDKNVYKELVTNITSLPQAIREHILSLPIR